MKRRKICILILIAAISCFIGCSKLQENENIVSNETSANVAQAKDSQTNQKQDAGTPQNSDVYNMTFHNSESNTTEEPLDDRFDIFYSQQTSHVSRDIDETSVVIGVDGSENKTLFSGVIIDEINNQLYILTCKHGFVNAGKSNSYSVTLQFSDGNIVTQKVSPILSSEYDLAIIKIDYSLSTKVKALELIVENYQTKEKYQEFQVKNSVTGEYICSKTTWISSYDLIKRELFTIVEKNDAIRDGASGGAVLSEAGNLAGILSRDSNGIIICVPLKNIMLFLEEI